MSTCGGILLAWRSSEIMVSNLIYGTHHITATVSSLAGDYTDKLTFLQDL